MMFLDWINSSKDVPDNWAQAWWLCPGTTVDPSVVHVDLAHDVTERVEVDSRVVLVGQVQCVEESVNH